MPATDYFIGAGSTAGVLGVVTPFLGKYLKHAITEIVHGKTSEIEKAVMDLGLKFAKETGGNSGGFRQAINEQGVKLGVLERDLAYIKGSLDTAARLTPGPGQTQ